jgi:hypothetical protein
LNCANWKELQCKRERGLTSTGPGYALWHDATNRY